MILTGKNVLITGGAGGIGSELARACLDRGARVLLAGRDLTALERTRTLLAQVHPADSIGVCRVDLADPADIERLATCARQWSRGIDVVVNNAGTCDFGWLEDQAATQVETTVAVNITAPLLLIRSLLPHLLERPAAAIVNIGSVFGAIGHPGFAAYSATKFALRGLSEALRRELAGTPVTVHHFAPRATRTPFNSAAVDALNEALGTTADTPREVALQLCAWLESGRTDAVFGRPERLFVRINAVLPRLVDASLVRQLPVIRRYARASGQPVAPSPLFVENEVTP